MSESRKEKMRISFDLDEVLFVNPKDHKVEPPPPLILKYIFIERLRFGTPKLINRLQELDLHVDDESIICSQGRQYG